MFPAADLAAMETLPPELIHHIVFSFAIPPSTTLALALTCRHLHSMILGPIFSPNPFDTITHRAQAGLFFCLSRHWIKPAILSLSTSPTPYPVSDLLHALLYAAKHNSTLLAEALLSHNSQLSPLDYASDDIYAASPLETAVEFGHIDLLSLLLLDDETAQRAADYNYLFQLAAEFGHAHIMEYLLTPSSSFPGPSSIDPTDQNNLALVLAAQHNHIDAVNFLLSIPEVNPTDRQNQAIYLAAEADHHAVVSALLSDPRTIPSFDDIVHWATWNGFASLVDLVSTLTPP